jgi:hypothetical protein
MAVGLLIGSNFKQLHRAKENCIKGLNQITDLTSTDNFSFIFRLARAWSGNGKGQKRRWSENETERKGNAGRAAPGGGHTVQEVEVDRVPVPVEAPAPVHRPISTIAPGGGCRRPGGGGIGSQWRLLGNAGGGCCPGGSHRMTWRLLTSAGAVCHCLPPTTRCLR